MFCLIECTAWMGWCDSSWWCGTAYDRDTYEARPPPSCPLPPPGTQPPVLPGQCRFNVSAGKCDFFPNSTSKQEYTLDIKNTAKFDSLFHDHYY